MSVAVEHRTVSLWPINGSPARSAPPSSRRDPATEALAAITSRYRRGRAGIIAGDVPPPNPTVPVAFVPPRTPEEAAPQPRPSDAEDDAPTFWSRLGRSRRPAPRGRHSPKP